MIEREELSFEIGNDGTIRTIYKDDLPEVADAIGAELSHICRASNVEWERYNDTIKGWTVRAAHEPNLAIRVRDGEYVVASNGLYPADLAFFDTREEALKWEVKLFWSLLPPKK